MDDPTNLRSARDYSELAHRELVDAGIIPAQPEPRDLAGLADAVFAVTTSQSELVRLLPRGDFQAAQPNTGHKIAIALLVEHIVGLIVTINFDLALDHAVAAIARGGITMCHDPSEHAQAGRYGIVYLHGSVNSEPDDWILRREQIENAWADTWHALMVAHAATIPNLIFAGLGSPAPVITESVQKIVTIVQDGTALYQVDPAPMEDNQFAKLLDLKAASYIQSGWVAFIDTLSQVVAKSHLLHLDQHCTAFYARNGLAVENHHDVLAALSPELLRLGKLRASWFMEKAEYKAALGLDPDLMADCIIGVAMAKRLSAATESIQVEDGFEFRRDGRAICRLFPVLGGGSKYWAYLEPKIAELAKQLRLRDRSTPLVYLLAGVNGLDESIVPDTLIPTAGDSIVNSLPSYSTLSIDGLRNNPDAMREQIA